MRSSLHRRLLQFFRHDVVICAGSRVGVAVSGGADSVALLFLLHEMQEELGVMLRILHFNHQLRGAEADADQAFVQELSRRLGLECVIESANVRDVAEQQGWNLEDAARRLRQQFFQGCIDDKLADCVVTAHTADDQAETVLMHLLRGTGIAGLSGIYPAVGPVIRPLLAVRRAELRHYLQERSQSWREDATNQDPSRLRARIRSQLLPILIRDFAPSAVDRLNSLARIAREETALSNEVVLTILRNKVQTIREGCWIQISDIQFPFRTERPAPVRQSAAYGDESLPVPAASVALQKKVIRCLIEKARGSLQGISVRHVEQVLALLEAEKGRAETHLPGLRVSRDLRHRLTFRVDGSETAAAVFSYCYQVELPAQGESSVAIRETGGSVKFKLFDCAGQGRDTKDRAEALDRDLLSGPLVLRNWRPGDLYRPQGRLRRHKLKHLFGESRIPQEERMGWPVVVCGDAIAWVRQFGAAADFAAGRKTRTGVLIVEEPI